MAPIPCASTLLRRTRAIQMRGNRLLHPANRIATSVSSTETAEKVQCALSCRARRIRQRLILALKLVQNRAGSNPRRLVLACLQPQAAQLGNAALLKLTLMRPIAQSVAHHLARRGILARIDSQTHLSYHLWRQRNGDLLDRWHRQPPNSGMNYSY